MGTLKRGQQSSSGAYLGLFIIRLFSIFCSPPSLTAIANVYPRSIDGLFTSRSPTLTEPDWLIRLAYMKHKDTKVSAFEAKTHLSRLLYGVEKGKAVTITRRGKPVARLVPMNTEQESLRTEEIIKGFKR